jgi:hypothetical protein
MLVFAKKAASSAMEDAAVAGSKSAPICRSLAIDWGDYFGFSGVGAGAPGFISPAGLAGATTTGEALGGSGASSVQPATKTLASARHASSDEALNIA